MPQSPPSSGRSLIYADCPECGLESPILEVDRVVRNGDALEPSENEDLQLAVYGRVPDPGELAPEVIALCPNGHNLKGAPVKSSVIVEATP